MFFFDSFGSLMVSCGADHPGAMAGGPTGICRFAASSEAGLSPRAGETDFDAANRQMPDRLRGCIEWADAE